MAFETRTSHVIRYAPPLAGLAAWALISWTGGAKLPADFLARPGQLVDFREGLAANVTVIREGKLLHLEIDRLWQGAATRSPQIMAAHVPALLHPRPLDILVIGLGPGQTASRFLMHAIDRLDCVDIEAQLVPMVREHFESGWMDDPRVRFIIEDGRSYLAHADAAYDVISIEVGQAFRPGVASFYTVECYEHARRRLKPQGLLCQFVPVSFFSTTEFQTIVQTFLNVFPHSVLWYNRTELLLIGSADREIKLGELRLEALHRDATLHEDLDFSYWGGSHRRLNRPEVFASGFLMRSASMGVLAKDATVYRDDRPFLEYATANRARLRARFEIPTVKLIRTHLDPIEQVLDHRPSWPIADAKVIRQRNLGDIVASVRAAGEHQAAAALLRQALDWNPDDIDANVLLADELTNQGNLVEAKQLLEHVLTIDRASPSAHYNLANILRGHGQLEIAAAHYQMALQAKPDFPQALNNLGSVLQSQGRLDEAVARYQQAVLVDANFAPGHYNLANALQRQGKVAEAIEHYHLALRQQPASAKTHFNLAMALKRQGRTDQAIDHYRLALRIDPQLAEAHQNLGNALAASNRGREAIKHYRAALQIRPQSPAALNALAWLLATDPDDLLHDPQEAIDLAEEAARLTSKQSPLILDTLAAAYAAANRFDAAVQIVESAIALADQANDTKMVEQLENRLELYRNRRSYRAEPAH